MKADIGKFLGAGAYGEAYEVDGGDKVLKISVAKSEAEAEALLSKLDKIGQLNSEVFPKLFDSGILCDVQIPGSKWMVNEGTAYFYVMEKLVPLTKSEAKIVSRTVNDLETIERLPAAQQAQERKKYMFSKARQYKRDGDIEEGDGNPLEGGAELFDKLRASGMSHSDMHSQNIMKNAQGQYKLIDLESAKFLKT